MRKMILVFIGLLIASGGTFSQCAMCRATLENSLSNGGGGIAAGINFGILYLFFAPYLAIGLIAFFWFRAAKQKRVNAA